VVELKEYYFCSTHLSLHAEDRCSSAKIIIDTLGRLDKPVIVAGDFNALVDEVSMQELQQHFTFVGDGTATYPSDVPSVRIDYIGVTNCANVSSSNYCVVNEPVASDHRPIFSQISISK
jgi:endonuclease/exonuclease/phosphatase family metal-dependent hydrolase